MNIADESQLEPIVKISASAHEQILQVLSEEDDSDKLALWIEVSGISGLNYTYEMYFQAKQDAGQADGIQHGDDLTLVVPATSIANLKGSILDIGEDGSMVLNNPNHPTPKVAAEVLGEVPGSDLSGEIPQKIMQVLETQVNPSIASHGGEAQLMGVEGGTAYLKLGGGCQGCGLAAVTLSQGIKVAIQEAVPEITEVVDVTDHAGGSNPFYEPAKK